MKESVKERRVHIVLVWVLFLILAGALFFCVDRYLYYHIAKEELLTQAEVVEKEIPEIYNNDLYSRSIFLYTQTAKLESLGHALQSYDSIDGAKEFLDRYVKAADVDVMVILDKEGNVLYRSEEELLVSAGIPDYVFSVLKGGPIRPIEVDRSEGKTELRVGETISGNEEWNMPVCVKDQWYLLMVPGGMGTKDRVRSALNWKNAMHAIRFGNLGSVLALDVWGEKGSVASFIEQEWEGSTLDEAGIRIGGETHNASPEELLTAFSDYQKAVPIHVAGKDYLAVRMEKNTSFTLILGLLPFEEIDGRIRDAVIMKFSLYFVISGLCMLYAFFRILDEESHFARKKNGSWSRSLFFKMQPCTILALIAIFLLSLYIGALLLYSDSFLYCSKKAALAAEIHKGDVGILHEAENWVEEEYLIKCRIAECILKDKEDITRKELGELAEALRVDHIYLFDRYGKAVVTNSPYDHITIDEDSALYPLLEGKPELVLPPEADGSDFVYQAGVSLRDGKDLANGFLLIETDSEEMQKIAMNLSPENAFQRSGLNDNTALLLMGTKDNIITYSAELLDGILYSGIGGTDMTEDDALYYGLDMGSLGDEYAGNIRLMDRQYISCITSPDDIRYAVLKPAVYMDRNHFLQACAAALIMLLFAPALIYAACMVKKREEGEEAEADHPETEGADEDLIDQDRSLVLDRKRPTIFSGNLDNKNPFFEDRWPGDGVKWQDKTPDEKYMLVSTWMIFLTLLSLAAYSAVTIGNNALFYLMAGNWDNGLNLSSFSACLVTVFILLVLKPVIHKLLYLLARIVDAKGETVCHLVDSSMGYALTIAGIFICLSFLGVNATTLSITTGVAGVVFGIGCQNIVSDILSGIIMTFEGTVQVGDFVGFNGRYGTVQSIGIRTTRIKWFSEVTVVRNNDFKNYVVLPSDKINRPTVHFTVDIKESLERVEEIIEKELPGIHDRLCEITKQASQEVIGPKYRGVDCILDNGYQLSFTIFCKGRYYRKLQRTMYRELIMMCERHDIAIALPQVIVNEPREYPEYHPEKEEGEETENEL